MGKRKVAALEKLDADLLVHPFPMAYAGWVLMSLLGRVFNTKFDETQGKNESGSF
jgi:hypothetical protein